MPEGKVHFTEEQINLASLYGRALDARRENPILGDPTAEDAVRRIDYDFGKFKIDDVMASSVAIRVKLFDDMVGEFLRAHPTATVLHLGCGMDSRVFRLDPPATVRWFDVDYPDVIALRGSVYPSERDGYSMIGSSVTDLDWLSRIPTDATTLVVAEGLTQYLDPDEGRALLRALVERLPSGEMIFDTFNRLGIRMQKANPVVRRAKATLRWGINDPRELEPLGLTLIHRLTAEDMVSPERRAAMSALYRFRFSLLKLFPALRNVAQVMHSRFGSHGR